MKVSKNESKTAHFIILRTEIIVRAAERLQIAYSLGGTPTQLVTRSILFALYPTI